MTALPKPNNPLLGTPLHRALQCLEEIQQHLKDDQAGAGFSTTDVQAMADIDQTIFSACELVRGELNRRFVELRRAEKVKTAPPAKLVLKVPGRNAAPVLFDRTRRGIDALLEFIADAMVDGGGAMVAMNHELLDLIAAKDKAWANEVAGLREAAMDALTPSGEE
jgi:hypothetical protein